MTKTNAERQRLWRERHPDRYRDASVVARERRKTVKQEVLTYYGHGNCACISCGEHRIECLSIDHIKGNGNKQRIGNLRNSHSFYLWLRKNNYPLGYQTLCMNCQWVKRFANKEHN